MQYVLNATEKELIRNNHMNQINLYNPDIVQDNADLAELAVDLIIWIYQAQTEELLMIILPRTQI